MTERETNLLTVIAHSFERPTWLGEIEKGQKAFIAYLIEFGHDEETRDVGLRMRKTLIGG